MSALTTLVLLLFSTNLGVGNSQSPERPLQVAASGLGQPVQPNEASNIVAAAGRSLWTTKEIRVPGSKKSVAILNGYCVQTHVLPVYRSLRFAVTTLDDFITVSSTPVRAPPVPAFAA